MKKKHEMTLKRAKELLKIMYATAAGMHLTWSQPVRNLFIWDF